MPTELARLIARYQWLQQESSRQGTVASRNASLSIADALDAVFLEIVKHPTQDPWIRYRQIAFLLGVMADTREGRVRAALRDQILAHVKRLTDQLGGAAPPQAHPPPMVQPGKLRRGRQSN
ncbi:MAG: hypothetical protein SFW09_08225 [Hyphomicrobiaceae bacterium]|nr:hypothetical protein [Hyphomicrobiaceae bacterium]